MDEKIPELTLTPDLTDTPAVEVSPKEAAPAPKAGPDLSSLSPAEQKAVLDFAEKIDLSNSGVVLQYGAAAQKNIANFSESTLNAVRTKDMGELGDMVSDLVAQLKGFSAEEEEKKGFLGMFKKASNNLQNMKIKYDKAETNVDKIAEQLEQHQVVLMKDVALLDQMYEKNLEYFKQLSMYILAGEKKLADERATTLQELYAKAQASGLPEDAQAANDYAALCDRFEKKLYDLKLTRQISIQMGPQIRMIQNNDNVMVEKIQTTLMNTIPLWKNQMVLALGIAHSNEAAQAQRQVNDITNALLKQNAEKLHMASVETAKEAERGIVDIETLKKTNAELIQTLDDVMKIQSEGREKRIAAEAEMAKMENDLKGKLLEIRGGV